MERHYLSIYLASYYSVRSRTLGSLVSGVVATVANIFWGWFPGFEALEQAGPGRHRVFLRKPSCWRSSAGNSRTRSCTEDSLPKVTLDWENPGFGRGFTSMVLMGYVSPL